MKRRVSGYLACAAVAGTMAAVPPAAADTLTLTPSSYAFPATQVGTTSTGVFILTLTCEPSFVDPGHCMTFGGGGATFSPVIATYGVFTQANGCGSQLQTLTTASCNIYVSFSPTEPLGYTGTLQVSGNGTAGTRAPRAPTLSGLGVAPPTKCKKKKKTAAATKKRKCRKKKR